jgi:hypothetical protein
LQSKKLGDDSDIALQIQGIGWLTRKAIGLATVTLHVKQYDDENGEANIVLQICTNPF